MPAAPIQPTAGLPSLTSSELYTQTLAAQADVLVAAKAWPLLTKSLADLTDIPGRQQLAIKQVRVCRVFPVTVYGSREAGRYMFSAGLCALCSCCRGLRFKV